MCTVRPMADASHLSDGEYRRLADFRYALRQFLAFSERAAREHGLAPAQHQLLLAVRGCEATGDAPSISDLAERLQLRAHSTAELVTRAVDHGLVERAEDPADRRRSLVTTSSQGRAVLEELSQLHRRELRRFRSEMSDLLADLGTDE